MSDTRLNLRKAWKFYRARLSDCLQSLKMQGYYHNKAARKQKMPVMSDALLEELRSNCPNIQELSFEYIDLANFSSNKLPRSLCQLTIVKCGWPVEWLKGAELPELQTLDLIHCVRVDVIELKTLVTLTSLETLRLIGLYRAKDEGLKHLAQNLKQLTHLELDGLPITDLSVHHICRNMKNLESLKVIDCGITNSGIQIIAASLPKLCRLDISKNKNIDQHCLKYVLKMKQLKSVVVTMDPVPVELNCMEELMQFSGTLINNYDQK